MQAVYYRDQNGHEPVNDFINDLPDEVQVTLDNQIDRLNMLAPDEPPLPFPHTSQVEGELRELRCHYGRRLFRVLYRRSDQLFILPSHLREEDRSHSTSRQADRATALGRLPRPNGTTTSAATPGCWTRRPMNSGDRPGSRIC
jgi:phage-related protein